MLHVDAELLPSDHMESLSYSSTACSASCAYCFTMYDKIVTCIFPQLYTNLWEFIMVLYPIPSMNLTAGFTEFYHVTKQVHIQMNIFSSFLSFLWGGGIFHSRMGRGNPNNKICCCSWINDIHFLHFRALVYMFFSRLFYDTDGFFYPFTALRMNN